MKIFDRLEEFVLVARGNRPHFLKHNWTLPLVRSILKKTKKKTFAGLIRRAATKLGLLYGNKRN